MAPRHTQSPKFTHASTPQRTACACIAIAIESQVTSLLFLPISIAITKVTKQKGKSTQMSIRRPLLLSLTTSTNTHNNPQQSPLLIAKLTSQSQTNHSFNQFSTTVLTMTTTPKPGSDSFFRVPGLDQGELDGIFDQTFLRYSLTSSPASPSTSSSNSTSNAQRTGNGVAIMWFRNDLRLLDNLALFIAWQSSQTVLPVYCIDPRLFSSTTYHFGFPKTGALRAQFLIQSLVDLRNNLRKCGLDLLVQQGKPEEILPSLAKAFGAHTVYAQKETCSEEVNVERRLHKSLQQVVLPAVPNQPSTPNKSRNSSLQLVWGSTLYHIDDLPFGTIHLPDVFTQFRKLVESKCRVRGCIKMPKSLGPPPQIEDWGNIPSTEELGIRGEKASKGCVFLGGESAALGRVHEYFWKKDLLKSYKETRNGMLGSDYSTKLSPWLASGSLSPRLIYEEVKRYEKARIANDSTYWVLFELIWRDYFRFLSIKYGNSIFHLGGPRKVSNKWSQDTTLFEAWRGGKTGYPLIDANTRELASTGFMSNRGRQIVCSFLVRDMGIDWRMGAEWFETCLLDYDPCSNYGNWTYGAGVGNDPREDRYFSIPKQAQVYDPDGEYVAYWLPELRQLPKPKRHSPGTTKYISPIVPLKFGNTGRPVNPKTASSMRQSNFRRR